MKVYMHTRAHRVSKIMLRAAHASFENNVWSTQPYEKIWCTDKGHYLQISFGSQEPNSRFAKHSITAEERNGVILIESWVIAEGNFGLYIDDVAVSNANCFVPALLALREKVAKDAVQMAYRAKYERN